MRTWQRISVVLLAGGAVLGLATTAGAQGPDDHAPDCVPGGCADFGQTHAPDDAGAPDDPGAAGGDATPAVAAPGSGVESLPPKANDHASVALASHPAIASHVQGIHELVWAIQNAAGPDRAALAQGLRYDLHELLLSLTGVLPNEHALFSVLGGANAED